MPALLLRARAAGPDGSDDDRALVALLDADLSGDEALERAVAALAAHEVVDETRALSVAHTRAAVAELEPLPSGPVKDALVSFADLLVHRAA
jgi:heptaprenyl diphosphate synthase